MTLKKGGSALGAKPSQKVIQGKRLYSAPFFLHALEISQPNFGRKDSAGDGTLRTLSRNDRAIINVPMAEARDFHCHSHVTDNLGEPSIPSDHVAIRVIIRKPFDFCGTVKHSPNWTSKTSRLLLHFEADQ